MNTTQHLEALDLADAGEWDASHRIVQQLNDPMACWIHANLHREEGDIGNANYWYARADRSCPDADIAGERASIRAALSS
jgi:hypothetical protein